jgi:phage shock protein B
MIPVYIVGIVFGSLILALVIIIGTVLAVIRSRHGGISRQRRKNEAEEARMMQEIFRGLSRMEKRVDALETILLDHTEKGRDE